MKNITPFLVLILVLSVLGISGCTDSSTNSSISKAQDFSNDFITFNYPPEVWKTEDRSFSDTLNVFLIPIDSQAPEDAPVVIRFADIGTTSNTAQQEANDYIDKFQS